MKEFIYWVQSEFKRRPFRSVVYYIIIPPAVGLFLLFALMREKPYPYHKCLRSDSTVYEENGQPVKVEAIRIGDKLLSREPLTGQKMIVTVTDLSSANRQNWIFVGQNLVVTPEHPIWTPSGWKPAGNLTSNSWVSGHHGIIHVAPQVIKERRGNAVNISVSAPHTYIAGDESILVHNKIP